MVNYLLSCFRKYYYLIGFMICCIHTVSHANFSTNALDQITQENTKDYSGLGNKSILNKILLSRGVSQNVAISGLMMGEFIYSNDNQGGVTRFTTPTASKKRMPYSTFCVPRVSVFVDSDINDWTHAHIALNFAPNKKSSTCAACGFGKKHDPLRFSKFDKIDESYVHFGNIESSPYYLKAGIQYYPYGKYNRNAIPATLSQLLSQIQAPGVIVGYRDQSNKLNISLYGFSGKSARKSSGKVSNVGIQLTYTMNNSANATMNSNIDNIYYTDNSESNNKKTVFNIGYINNIANSVNYIISSTPTCCGKEKNSLSKSYRKTVGGISAGIEYIGNRFDFNLNVTSALNKFHKQDVMWKQDGAIPIAGLIGAGYNFKVCDNISSRIGVTYQLSDQALNVKGNGRGLGLPKQRMQMDYTIIPLRNVEIGSHLMLDKDYARKYGGTNKTSLIGLVTLMIKI